MSVLVPEIVRVASSHLSTSGLTRVERIQVHSGLTAYAGKKIKGICDHSAAVDAIVSALRAGGGLSEAAEQQLRDRCETAYAKKVDDETDVYAH